MVLFHLQIGNSLISHLLILAVYNIHRKTLPLPWIIANSDNILSLILKEFFSVVATYLQIKILSMVMRNRN